MSADNDKRKKYYITTGGSTYEVDVDDVDKNGWDGYAADFPDATVRMRDKDGADYDIPVSKAHKAINKGYRPYTVNKLTGQAAKEWYKDKEVSDKVRGGDDVVGAGAGADVGGHGMPETPDGESGHRQDAAQAAAQVPGAVKGQTLAERQAAAVEQLQRSAASTMTHVAGNQERLRNMGEYGFKGNLGNAKKSSLQYNPASGKIEQTYITPLGSRYSNKALADAEIRDMRHKASEPLPVQMQDKETDDEQRPAHEAVKALWDEAERLHEADMEANAKDVYSGSAWMHGGREMRAMDSGLYKGKNDASRLKRFDLQQMADNAWERVGAQMTQTMEAKLRKQYPDAPYAQLHKSAQQAARQLSDNAVYKYAVKKNMPKSTLDYFAKTALDANLMTTLSKGLAREAAGTTGDMEAYEAAMGEYGKDHRTAQIGGTVVGMALDPTTYMAGGFGSWGSKMALNAGGRLFAKKAATDVGARLFGNTLTGRIVAGAAGGGANFAAFEGIKEGESQLLHGGHINAETGQNEGYSAGDILKASGRGLLLGSTTGTLSPVLGNVADKMTKAASTTLGKAGIRAGEMATSTIAEGTIFSVPEWISGDADAMDVWTDNMAMMLGFKGQHLIKSAPSVIAGLRPVGEPRTMQERNHNRMSFMERLRRQLDASPSDLQFSKEEREELSKAGYGELSELFRRKHRQAEGKSDAYIYPDEGKGGEFKRVDVEDSADQAREEWLKQHPEFDGYADMERLMQDKTVSQSARAKAYYILTGRQLPMGTVTGYTTETDEDGNTYVKAVTSDGEVVTSRLCADDEAVKREQGKILRQAELNSVDVGEQYVDAKADDKVWEAAVEAVAPGADPDTVKRNYLNAKQGDKDAIASYGQMFEAIDKYIEGHKEMIDAERPEAIRAAIKEATGVDVDNALKKDPSERDEAERRAVQGYIEILFDSQKADAQKANEEGTTAADRLLQQQDAVASAVRAARDKGGKVESHEDMHKASREADEAERAVMDLGNGEAIKRSIDKYLDLGDDGVGMLNEMLNGLTTEEHEAAVRYIEARSVIDGVEDRVIDGIDGQIGQMRNELMPYVNEDGEFAEITIDGEVRKVKGLGDNGALYYWDEDGQVRSVMMDDASVDRESFTGWINMEEYLRGKRDEIWDESMDEANARLANNPRTNAVLEVGDEFVVPGRAEDGSYTPVRYKVVGRAEDGSIEVAKMRYKDDAVRDADGSVQGGYVVDGSESVRMMAHDEAVAWQNEEWDEYDRRDEKRNGEGDDNGGHEMPETPDGEKGGNVPNEEGNVQNEGGNVQNEGGNVPDEGESLPGSQYKDAFERAVRGENGFVLPEEQTAQMKEYMREMASREQQRKEEHANREQTALERVPVDEKTGEPMFEVADRETALDALNELTGGNEASTAAIVTAQVEQARHAAEAVKKKKPVKKNPPLKGSPMQMIMAQQEADAAYNTAMEQYNAQMGAAEETLNAWTRIYSLMNERKRAVREQQEAEQKEHDARLHDEAVAQLEEQKRIAAEKAAVDAATAGRKQRAEAAAQVADGAGRDEENKGRGAEIVQQDEKVAAALERVKETTGRTLGRQWNESDERSYMRAIEEAEKKGMPLVDSEGELVSEEVIELAQWAEEQGLQIDTNGNGSDYGNLVIRCDGDFSVFTDVPDRGDSFNMVWYHPEAGAQRLADYADEFNKGRRYEDSAVIDGDMEGVLFHDGKAAREFEAFVQKAGTVQGNEGNSSANEGETPLSERIATASADVNTEPTEAQKEAGNYKKGHVQVGTFDITIEQPEGSVRRGTDANGKKWESKMHNTYGYFRGTEGVDGDHIDVFLSNDIDGWNGRKVYVVDQYNPDGTFDEHKVMLGFNDADEAKSDYLANYEKGWEDGRRIDVSAVNLEDFEKWVESSHRKTKPFAEYAGVRKETVENAPAKEIKQAEVSESEGYTITPSTYTNKKGKTSDVSLLTFDHDLTADQERAVKEFAKERTGEGRFAPARGWKDRESGGWIFRNEEDARKAAEMVGNEEAVADNQPLTAQEMRDAVEPGKPAERKKATAKRPANKVEVADVVEQKPSEPTKAAEPAKEDKPQYEVSDEEMNGLMNDIRDILGIGDDEGDAGLKFRDPDELTAEQRQKLMSVGQRLAMAMVERGNESFKDYASMMVKALGNKVRPWLKAFYGGLEYVPGYDKYALTPYEEVKAFDVENFDKPQHDVLAQANMIVEEGKAQVAANKANNELKEIRNEQRKETEKQTAADTDAVAAEAETVASETEAIAETSSDEQEPNGAAERVDDTLDKVNDQLALLGYYEAEHVEKDYNEMSGYMRNAEKKAVKDAADLASQLIEDLGLDRYEATHGEADKKGVRKKPLAVANISPVGGDVTIHLPLADGRELYVDVQLAPAAEKGVTNYGGDNLEVTGIMCRVDNLGGKGNDHFGPNVWLARDVSYSELLKRVQLLAYKYIPEREGAVDGVYKVGDRVQYSVDGKTWSDAVVAQPNEEGGIRIDTGHAPAMWVNATSGQLRHKPSESAEPKNEAVGDFYENGINEDAVAALPEDAAIQLHVVDILNPGMTDNSMKSKIASLNYLLPKISDKKLAELDKEYGDDKVMGTHIKAEVKRREHEGVFKKAERVAKEAKAEREKKRAEEADIMATDLPAPAKEKAIKALHGSASMTDNMALSEARRRVAQKKASKKKVEPEQQVGDLFAGLLDEEKDNGLQRNDDAVRTGAVPADRSGQQQGLRGGERAPRKAAAQESGRPDGGRGGQGAGGNRAESAGLHGLTEPKNTRNNHSERGADHAPTSVNGRIEANIKAIELAHELLESGETATPEQMNVLRQFSGWGGLGAAFSDGGVDWKQRERNQKIRELLGEEAYEQAVMSANSAYYTPAYVVDTLWDIAGQLGFKGGKILEGSAGIGNMLGQMPAEVSGQSDIHAIEIDGTSGGILSLLYPDAKVDIQGFEQTRIPNGSVDLAITNVPFVTGLRVNDTTGDSDLSRKFHNIHDFCIAKNVRKLREGGLGIFISSNGTLDGSKALRDWVVNEGGSDFIGAFRMNNKTFGGTTVTSDIIVIRKRVNGQKSAQAIDVSTISGERTAEYEEPGARKAKQVSMDYNKYFIEHPDHMAGEMRFAFEEGDTFRPTSKGLYPVSGKDQGKMLADFVKSFTEETGGSTEAPENEKLSFGVDASAEGKRLGEMYLLDGKLVSAGFGDIYYPLEINDKKIKGHTKQECFNAYAAIKTALADVMKYQTENEDNAGLKPLIAKLNKAYDDFVNTYGHFTKNNQLAWLRNDVDYPNVFSLETYKEQGDGKGGVVKTYGKADVMKDRVVEKESEPHPENVKDGVVVSMFKNGRIDVPYIAGQLGKSEEAVKREIIDNGLGFEDPATRQMEVSYQYLSGNVREKLKQAEANNENGEYTVNIKALQEVVPMNIPAHLIDFTLGSSWLDPKLYDEYVKDRTDIDVHFTSAGGTWFMKAPTFGVKGEKNRAMGVVSEKLKKTIMGHELIEAAIQNKSIVVSRTEKHYDGTTETITDREATAACAAKIDEIRQDFKDWARQKMQGDAELSARMETEYNDRFNNYVPMSIPDDFVPEYFGGATHRFKMRPHQGKAIVRGTMQPLLLAHEVGTGKTFTLISTAMEMRRLGTARKPMIVVQNATVGQFAASAKELYPNAKILTLEDNDRNAEGRKNFYAKIKYNDWDMIVVPQSTFEFIPDSDERQMQFVQDKIDEKMLVLEKMREADSSGRDPITRSAEKELADLQAEMAALSDGISKKRTANDEKKKAVAKQNATVKAQEMLDRRTDDVEDFDDMGIDALLIDEAHEYKHLGFATAMQRGVKGVDPSYSKKSQGVYLKTQAILEKNNGRNVIFATGTPISNTAAEIWTFMRYLMPKDTMKEYGIYYFDDFVRNFGNIQQMPEFGTSGKFKEVNRFAGYVNLPELVRIWSGVADTVLTKDQTELVKKIPEMEGGKAQDIYLPQTRALRSVMKYVRDELERFDQMSGKEKKENSSIPLTMYGIAQGAAVDARLVEMDAEDDPRSKTNEAVRQTLQSLKETDDYKGTVAIFADHYQNKRSGFNLYEDIKKKLIAQGVPADEVVVMKPGMTIKKKLDIFDKVNRGEVRVVLGSTATLGTGVNIQERLHTLIHLDAPNRPMDYTQRNGRILRQGNLHKQWGKPVRVLRFGVEDSLDVTAYQRLKTKGAIADSVMEGDRLMQDSMNNRVLEEAEDVFGDTVAQLSGSEYALLKNNAEKNVRKYMSRKKQWEADQTYIHNAKPKVEGLIKVAEQWAEEANAHLLAVQEAFPDGKFTEITVGKQKFGTVDDMADFIKEHNKKIHEATKVMKKNPGNSSQTSTLTLSLGGYDFVVKTELSRETQNIGGSLFADIHRKMSYSCPKLGLTDVPVKQSLLRNAVEDITENVITGKDFAERFDNAARAAAHGKSELEQLKQREGKPFEFGKELEEAERQLEEYTEAMKQELAEKEKKYAEMDASVEAATDIVADDEDDTSDDKTKFRLLDDDDPKAMELEALPESELVPVYRNVQAFEDDALGSPMAFIDAETGERRTLQGGKWNYSNPQSIKLTAEQQHKLDELNRNGYIMVNGRKSTELKISDGLKFVKGKNGEAQLSYWLKKNPEDSGVWAAYNPYDHAVETPLNTQFSTAYKRPNLVVVRSLMPKSELEGHYHADYAKDSTGAHLWNNGRTLYLSRWSKIDKVLTREEEAKLIDEYWKKNPGKRETSKVHRDYNHFVPQVRRELEKMGYRFELDGKELTPEESRALDEQNWENRDVIPGMGGQLPYMTNEDIARINAKMAGKWVGEPKEAMEDAMTARVEELSEKLHTPVRIIRGEDEVAALPSARQRRMKGSFNPQTGEVTIVVPNNANLADIENTFVHEVVGHDGLRVLFPEEEKLNNALDELYRVSNDSIQQTIDRMAQKMYDAEVDRLREKARREHEARGEDASEAYLADMIAAHEEAAKKREQFRRDATEEYGADLGGRIGEKGFEKMSAEEQTFWGKLKATLQKALQKLLEGLRIPGARRWSDKDWAFVLHEAYKRKRNGGKPSALDVADTMEMRRKTGYGEDKSGADKGIKFRDGGTGSQGKGHRLPVDPGLSDDARKMYERRINDASVRFIEAWQDSMQGLKVLYDSVMEAEGKTYDDVADWENAYMAENHMSSVNQAEFEAYRQMLYKPMLASVFALQKDGAEYEDILKYIVSKHGLERNEVFARRDAKAAAMEEADYDSRKKKIEVDYIKGNIALADYQSQLAALDAERQTAEDEAYGNNRERDYSGLTQLYEEQGKEKTVPELEQEAKDFVDAFEARHDKSKIDDMWSKIRACNDATLDKQLECGLINSAARDSMRDMFEYYVPLRGFDDTTSDEVYTYLAHSMSPMNKPVKEAKGRKSLADDPIATIGNMAESGIMEGNRNKMKEKFLAFAENHHSTLVSVGDVHLKKVKDVNGEYWESVFPVFDKDDSPQDIEVKRLQWEQSFERARQNDPDSYAYAHERPNIPYRTLRQNLSEHQVIVKRGGKDVVLTVNANPRAAQALNGLTNPHSNANPFIKGFEKINRELSAMYTNRNPAFVLANLSRDGFYANSMVWVKESPQYARRYNANWRKCLMSTGTLVKKYKAGTLNRLDPVENMFYEFIMNGGETGYTSLNSVNEYRGMIADEYKKQKRRGLDPRRAMALYEEGLDTFNRWAEGTSRFTAYMTSRQMGRSVMRSVHDAKEASVNFNKKGAGASVAGEWDSNHFFSKNNMQVMNAWASQVCREAYIFFNAGVQGVSNISKAAWQHKGKFSGLSAVYFAVGCLMPLIGNLLGEAEGYEDKYWTLSEYTRRTNLCLCLGDYTLKLPLPIELRLWYGLGELAAGQMLGKTHYTAAECTEQMASQLGQVLPLDPTEGGASAIIPSYVKPLYEIDRNRNFMDMPIERRNQYNENMPNWTKAYKGTSPWLVNLAETLNEASGGTSVEKGAIDIDPAIIEHLFSGYFGGVGTMILQTCKTAMMPWNEDARDVRDVPIVSRFVASNETRAKDRSVNETYYDNKARMDEFGRKYNAYTRMLESADALKRAEATTQLQKLVKSEDYVRWVNWKEMSKALDKLLEESKLTQGSNESIELQVRNMKEAMNNAMADGTDEDEQNRKSK